MILLGPVELRVDSSLGYELHVVTLLHYLSVLDDADHIRILDGGQAMGNDNASASRAGGVESLLDQLFALQVQGRGGLVQQQDLGIPHQSPGNGNPLLLSPRELSAPGSHPGIIAIGQADDEAVGVGTLGRCYDLRHGHRSPVVTIGYVLRDGSLEESGLLGDDAQAGSHSLQGQVMLDVVVVNVLGLKKVI